uniref:uncharacterized protein LOC122609497 n=1 Tax=Erigeron canadensis TaxID=72917 RepID=UPI001CB9C8CE|nr:uncharacterized protein LOC122609497 [Erigeron canadensis]
MSSASSAAPVSQEESTTSSGSDEYDDAIESVAIAVVQLAMRVAQDAPPIRPMGFFRRTTLVRRRVEANDRLMRHYFSENPTYNPRQFRRRFCMSKRLFLKISGDVEVEYPYFQQRYDATGKLGFSAIQKCTSVLRQLATGQTGDLFDKYLEMSERTSRETVEKFCRGSFYVNENFYKTEYYLTDDIYPEYTTFVNSFTGPFDEKRQLFKRKQESARKVVERAFAVRDREVHNMLKADLVDHLWANKRRGGAQPNNELEFNLNNYVSDEE